MAIMQSGSAGAEVLQLQKALQTLGYTNVAADGIFGTNTKAAVMHFQSTYGLTIDGIVGIETFAAIKSAVTGQPILPTKSAMVLSKPKIVSPITPAPAGGGFLSDYQNYILYGAIGLIGIIILMRMTKKRR